MIGKNLFAALLKQTEFVYLVRVFSDSSYHNIADMQIGKVTMTQHINHLGCRLQLWSKSLKNTYYEDIVLFADIAAHSIQIKQYPELCPDEDCYVLFDLNSSNTYLKNHYPIDDNYLISVETIDVLLAGKHIDTEDATHKYQEYEATLEMCCSLVDATISPGSLINIILPQNGDIGSTVQHFIHVLTTAASSVSCKETTTEDEGSTKATSIEHYCSAGDLIDDEDDDDDLLVAQIHKLAVPYARAHKPQAYLPTVRNPAYFSRQHDLDTKLGAAATIHVVGDEPSAGPNQILEHNIEKANAFWDKQFENSAWPESAIKPTYISRPQTIHKQRQTLSHSRLHNKASAWAAFATDRGGQSGRIRQQLYKPKTFTLPFRPCEKAYVGRVNVEVARPDTGGYLADTTRDYSRAGY